MSRPGERRDPYSLAFRFKAVADAFRNKQRRCLWVPAFAGTTPSACQSRSNLSPQAGRGKENYALAMSGNTASILVFSVAALNGLTM